MESPELSEVRLRLEEAMNMNGWSQVDAAEKSGMTQSTLSRFLAGAGISAENQERLLKFLNEQPEAMVPSSSEMRQPSSACFSAVSVSSRPGVRAGVPASRASTPARWR